MTELTEAVIYSTSELDIEGVLFDSRGREVVRDDDGGEGRNEEDSLPVSAVNGRRSVAAGRGTALAGKESVGVNRCVQSHIISAAGLCFFSNCSDAQTHGNPNNQRIRSPRIRRLRLRIRQGRVPTGTRLALRAPAGYAKGGPRVTPAGPWPAQPCKFDMPQT